MLHVKILNNRDDDILEYALPGDYPYSFITTDALKYFIKKDNDWFFHGVKFSMIYKRDYAEKDLF